MDSSVLEKAHRIKCIFVDLDGTTLRTNGVMSQYTSDIFRKLIEKGYYVGISTGRALTCLGYVLEPVKFITNCPSIGCCGAEAGPACEEKGKRILYKPFPLDTLKDMMRFIYDHHFDFSCDGFGSHYMSSTRKLDFYNNAIRISKEYNVYYPDNMLIHSYEEAEKRMLDNTVLKPMILYRDDTEQKLITDWIDAHPSIARKKSAHSQLYEVMRSDVSKASAMETVCRHLGISAEECCSFGDSENDVEIFEAAGLSVAVCNGIPCALEKADIITEYTNDEDGPARTAAKLFLE